MPGIQCYAIRRLNPFLGVIQVVEAGLARAISVNGVVWDIEVGVEVRDSAWGSLNAGKTEIAYYRYGLWSLEEGLVSRPLSPQFQNASLQPAADRLIAAIQDNLSQMPFPLMDNHEFWLLDEKGSSALALLASVREGQPRPRPEPRRWQSSVGENGVASQKRFPHAEVLEEAVKQRAGFNLRRRWIERHADGSGTCLRSGEQYPAEWFPVFLLTEDWPAAEHQQLVSDFIHWTAPALLTLQHLQEAQRSRLERQLHLQSCSIEHHWHLYPQVLEEALLTSARVKCRLETATR